ncbi:MAG: flagellar biosynthetic protein FliQ [Pseudomonadota bacterium]
MDSVILFDALREGLWVAVIMTTPVLAVALIVGIAVGLFQALTSIQEMTLTFVPKLAAMLIAFWMTMNFMTESLKEYFQVTLIPLVKSL